MVSKEIDYENQGETDQPAESSKLEGNHYLKQQKFSQAIQAYNTALNYKPSPDISYKVSLNLCVVYHKTKNLDSCISQANLFLQNNPDDPKALCWLAKAYSAKKEELMICKKN